VTIVTSLAITSNTTAIQTGYDIFLIEIPALLHLRIVLSHLNGFPPRNL